MKFPVLIFLAVIFSFELYAQTNDFNQSLHPSTVSVGAGEIFVPRKNKVPYMANFTVNLDLKLHKTFFLKIGLDLFDHQSWQTGGMIYIGPEFNFNILSVKKISLSTYIGVIGIIGGDGAE